MLTIAGGVFIGLVVFGWLFGGSEVVYFEIHENK